MTTTGWGYSIRGSDQLVEVDELGTRLSLEIDCAVHYPAFGKHIFECKCGVLFPVYFLKYGDWETVKKKHEGGNDDRS